MFILSATIEDLYACTEGVLHYQGPRIDFQSEGAEIVLYFVSPRGAFMMDAPEGKNFVFWFSRTQKNVFLDMFAKILFLCHKCYLYSRKMERPWPLRPLRLRGPW